MSVPIFEERPIAVIWDFDDTLISGSMQTPLFKRFGIDKDDFWDEANGLRDFYLEQGLDLVSDDTLYLNHILAYVRARKFSGLSNRMLRELGAEVEFYPGLPEFFATSKALINDDPVYTEQHIRLEHYIVSTGLRQMILGSEIAGLVDGVWACEFAERVAGPGYLEQDQSKAASHTDTADSPSSGEIQEIVYTINNTTKTRAVFEINKGVNRDPAIEVNAKIDPEDRRVPFENMIYIADGPSDVPVFSVVRQFGGQTFAVYDPESDKEFTQVVELSRQDRVDAFGEADYRPKKLSARWIEQAIMSVARRMIETRAAERERSLATKVGAAPRHLGG